MKHSFWRFLLFLSDFIHVHCKKYFIFCLFQYLQTLSILLWSTNKCTSLFFFALRITKINPYTNPMVKYLFNGKKKNKFCEINFAHQEIKGSCTKSIFKWSFFLTCQFGWILITYILCTTLWTLQNLVFKTKRISCAVNC